MSLSVVISLPLAAQTAKNAAERYNAVAPQGPSPDAGAALTDLVSTTQAVLAAAATESLEVAVDGCKPWRAVELARLVADVIFNFTCSYRRGFVGREEGAVETRRAVDLLLSFRNEKDGMGYTARDLALLVSCAHPDHVFDRLRCMSRCLDAVIANGGGVA